MEEEYVDVSLSQEDLMRLAHPFAQLINEIQQEHGEDVHNVISAGLYAMGSALAQVGVHLDVGLSIKEAVGPLSIGYEVAMDHIKKKKLM